MTGYDKINFGSPQHVAQLTVTFGEVKDLRDGSICVVEVHRSTQNSSSSRSVLTVIMVGSLPATFPREISRIYTSAHALQLRLVLVSVKW